MFVGIFSKLSVRSRRFFFRALADNCLDKTIINSVKDKKVFIIQASLSCGRYSF